MSSSAQSLLSFIDNSPTAFHVVDGLATELMTQGFEKLEEKDTWQIKEGGNYFVCRADASIVAFRAPSQWSVNSSFKIIGAHTDSPSLKIKNKPTSTKEGYQMLNIEVYGGALLTSWFDKDLLIGGRVLYQDEEGAVKQILVQLPYRLRIPRLAIHLDRTVNKEGFLVNPQEHLCPILGLDEDIDFEAWITKEIGIQGQLLSWDLFLFDAEKASFGGVNNEFIYASRLDNLGSVHAATQALLSSTHHAHDFLVAAFFQHEEVGSTSQNGADSNFMETVLKRIVLAFTEQQEPFFQAVASSLFISTDMTHAVHPNYGSAHDPNHKPMLNKGPVIKSNANMRYATDAFSIAKFKQWCYKAGVSYQDFCNRNDMGCGSTIGPMVAANLGMATIDVGNAMLSMHSIREMAGTHDHQMMIDVFEAFFDS